MMDFNINLKNIENQGLRGNDGQSYDIIKKHLNHFEANVKNQNLNTFQKV
jgi:hypothetical protein